MDIVGKRMGGVTCLVADVSYRTMDLSLWASVIYNLGGTIAL